MRAILAYLAEMWAGEPHIIPQNIEMLLLFYYFTSLVLLDST